MNTTDECASDYTSKFIPLNHDILRTFRPFGVVVVVMMFDEKDGRNERERERES